MSTSATDEEIAAAFRELVHNAAPATTCPANMAQQVLRAQRRLRVRRTLIVASTVSVAAGVLAASTLLGHTSYSSMIQPSGAMEPTIGVGDMVVLNGDLAPSAGDVVVATATDGRVEFQMLSRVLAMPGDSIGCPAERDGQCAGVEVNGERISDAYLASLETKPFTTVTVPPGEVFLLGDNRKAAIDSRNIGPVALSDVTGVAVQVQTPGQQPRPIQGAPLHDTPEDQGFDPPGPIPPAQEVTP